MYTEKQISKACEGCRSDFKQQESCPREIGCSSIPVLACQIRSLMDRSVPENSNCEYGG